MAYPSNAPVPLNFNNDELRTSQACDCKQESVITGQAPAEPSSNNDLLRLESSVQWLKRELMVVELELLLRAKKRVRRLPRAGQLPSASEMSAASTGCSYNTRDALLPFYVAPALASERLQFISQRRLHHYQLSRALCVLLACLVAGSIAYHIAPGGVFPTPESVQGASLRAR
jgi:hypothetical protein